MKESFIKTFIKQFSILQNWIIPAKNYMNVQFCCRYNTNKPLADIQKILQPPLVSSHYLHARQSLFRNEI